LLVLLVPIQSEDETGRECVGSSARAAHKLRGLRGLFCARMWAVPWRVAAWGPLT